MRSHRRVVISFPLSSDIAEEFKSIAKSEGKTVSGLFHDMFNFYKQEKLKKEFYSIQECGAEQFRRLNITEEEIEQ